MSAKPNTTPETTKAELVEALRACDEVLACGGTIGTTRLAALFDIASRLPSPDREGEARECRDEHEVTPMMRAAGEAEKTTIVPMIYNAMEYMRVHSNETQDASARLTEAPAGCWTREAPAETGWYYTKRLNGSVEIARLLGDDTVGFVGSRRFVSLGLLRDSLWWSLPIHLPPLPDKET